MPRSWAGMATSLRASTLRRSQRQHAPRRSRSGSNHAIQMMRMSMRAMTCSIWERMVLIFGRQAQFRIHFSLAEASIQWGKHRFCREDRSMVVSDSAGQRVYEVIQLLLFFCFSLCDVLGARRVYYCRSVMCVCVIISLSIAQSFIMSQYLYSAIL